MTQVELIEDFTHLILSSDRCFEIAHWSMGTQTHTHAVCMIKAYLGHDKSVAGGVPWGFRAVLHGVEEQDGHDLCRGTA